MVTTACWSSHNKRPSNLSSQSSHSKRSSTWGTSQFIVLDPKPSQTPTHAGVSRASCSSTHLSSTLPLYMQDQSKLQAHSVPFRSSQSIPIISIQSSVNPSIIHRESLVQECDNATSQCGHPAIHPSLTSSIELRCRSVIMPHLSVATPLSIHLFQ